VRTSPLAWLAVGLLAAACSAARPAPESGSAAAVWVEIGPGGSAQARAITEGTACPALTLDGSARPMQVRAGGDGRDFPVIVCESSLPAGVRAADVAGQALALPAPAPRRIVVIGDTGCRLKAPADFQACRDPAAWPFARVATSAAAWRPDLVLHLGDYLYRESPCPPGDARCAGSPAGDTWASWHADFFAPAAPLLRAAPWIVIRGNHEICSRAGGGWFRFLDPRPRPDRCTDDTPPYVIPLGAVLLAVVDSAPASDIEAPAADVARYAAQFDRLALMRPPYTWLATHRPVWAGVNVDETGKPTELASGNRTLQAAIRDRLPAAVTLLLAGHVHRFEALAFSERRPPVLVVGHSGTALDPPITERLAGLALDGVSLRTVRTIDRFGYVTMEPAGADWWATVHDVDGGVLAECTVAPGTLTCTP
jgi:hypothetical protein